MLEALLAWDERMFRRLNGGWLEPTLDQVMPYITDARYYPIFFVLVALVVIVIWRLPGLRFVVLAMITVVVADAIGNYVFKQAFIRPRPCIALEDVRLLVGCTDSPSFPSNHAVNAGVLATLVMLYLPRFGLPALALALLVGYSRIYVGVHYPLDVLGGGLLGMSVALLLVWIMNLLWPSPTGLERPRRMFALDIKGS
jgi:undecaprenyl-diphosphatase